MIVSHPRDLVVTPFACLTWPIRPGHYQAHVSIIMASWIITISISIVWSTRIERDLKGSKGGDLPSARQDLHVQVLTPLSAWVAAARLVEPWHTAKLPGWLLCGLLTLQYEYMSIVRGRW